MIAIFFVTVGVVAFMYLTGGSEPEEPQISGGEFPTPTEQPQQEITIVNSVQTKSGERVQVRDFTNDEGVELLEGEERSYRIGAEEGPNGPLFEIFFFGDYGGSITVSLLDEDLRFARGRAEAVLQERLGVDGVLELCSYDIRVTTPLFVSEEYSGRNLGLSACPGSVQF